MKTYLWVAIMGIAFSVGQGAFGGSRLRKKTHPEGHFGRFSAGQIATAGKYSSNFTARSPEIQPARHPKHENCQHR